MAYILRIGNYEGNLGKAINDSFPLSYIPILSEDGVNYSRKMEIKGNIVQIQLSQINGRKKQNIVLFVSSKSEKQANFIANHLESVLHLNLKQGSKEDIEKFI